jgi:hypothetical protein
MYNNPYNPYNLYNQYNAQMDIDKVDQKINELNKLKQQMQNPVQPIPNLTQNFQIAPTNREVIKYANTIDEVQRDMVVGDTPYFSKDMSVVWIKNTKGEIRTYELNEIKPMDEKDMQIQYLNEQLEELKKEIKKNEHNANVDPRFDEQDTPKHDDEDGATVKNAKSTSVQRISTSKKR